MTTETIKLPSINVTTSGEFTTPNNPNLFNLTSLENDLYYKELRTVQSMKPGIYDISNFIPDDCGQTKAREVQVSQPAISFNGGHWGGKNGCLIDKDSSLRFEDMTNKNYINQLFTRFTLTTPYIRGLYDVEVESVLKPGEKTDTQRPCNVLSGKSLLTHYYTPMIKKLRNEVQNPDHIIPENTDETWVRGGLPSRQIMRNIDYMKRCDKV
jgi:hypothetical protein